MALNATLLISTFIASSVVPSSWSSCIVPSFACKIITTWYSLVFHQKPEFLCHSFVRTLICPVVQRRKQDLLSQAYKTLCVLQSGHINTCSPLWLNLYHLHICVLILVSLTKVFWLSFFPNSANSLLIPRPKFRLNSEDFWEVSPDFSIPSKGSSSVLL